MVKRVGKSDFQCNSCGQFIDIRKNKYVLIGTYNNGKHNEEVFFHFECFRKWFQEKITERSKQQVEFMQKKAVEVLNNPMIKGMMSNVAQRFSDAYSGDDHPKKITLVSKKIENGRKKRRKQAKMQ